MNKILKEILKVIGIYGGYLLLTIIFFYIFGLYVWTTPPTKLVLARMIGFPFILTIATEVFIILINKLKKEDK
ncbi:MAG: hypothetical protein K2J20_05900 [Bacilli bacterium]|nr:hypothetical protein [Bacilli bacterium]